MGSAILAAVIGVIGVVLGATYNHFYGKEAEKSKEARKNEVEAYLDYVQSVCSLSTLTADHPDRPKAFALSLKSKVRILLFGRPEVIKSLADFEQLGLSIENEEQKTAFVTMVHSMRAKPAIWTRAKAIEDLKVDLQKSFKGPVKSLPSTTSE